MKKGRKPLWVEEFDFEITWGQGKAWHMEVPGESVRFTLSQYENLTVYSWFLDDDVQGRNEKTGEGILVCTGQKHFQ